MKNKDVTHSHTYSSPESGSSSASRIYSTHTHTRTHACTHACAHARTCMHTRTWMHVHTYACAHACTHMHTHMYARTCMRTRMHVHTPFLLAERLCASRVTLTRAMPPAGLRGLRQGVLRRAPHSPRSPLPYGSVLGCTRNRNTLLLTLVGQMVRQNAHFTLLPFADAAFLTDGRFGATLHQPAWRHSFSSSVCSLPVPVPHIGNSRNIPDFSLLLYF